METIERIAQVAYEADRAYCTSLGDNSHLPWNTTSEAKRRDAISRADALLNGTPLFQRQGRTATDSPMHHRLLNAVVMSFKGELGALEEAPVVVKGGYPKTMSKAGFPDVEVDSAGEEFVRANSGWVPKVADVPVEAEPVKAKPAVTPVKPVCPV